MSFVIGRCTLPGEPKSVEHSGNQVTFTFHLYPASDANHLKALRQQLVGLVDNRDEEVVPLVWSLDSTYDGFYRPLAATVPPSNVMIERSAIPDCSITLERLTGYANTTFEVSTQSVVRTNGDSVTTPVSTIGMALPLASGGFWDFYPGGFTASSTMSALGEDGSAYTMRTVVSDAPFALTYYRFSCPPSKFYVGACLLEVKYGSTWRPVIGRDLASSATSWRISNGFVRLTSAAGTGGAGTIEVHNGSAAWESANIALYQNDGPTDVPIGQEVGGNTPPLTVLRNAPEGVAVRVTGDSADLTFSVRRGVRYVGFDWADTSNTLSVGRQWGVQTNSNGVAFTSFTGGIRQTSNDANGNRLVFIYPGSRSSDLVNGELWETGGTENGSMAIGVDLNGGGATPATDLRDEFYGAVSQRQRVIVR